MSPRPRCLPALLVLTRRAGGGPTRDQGAVARREVVGWQVGTAPAPCKPRAQRPRSDPAVHPRPDSRTADAPRPLQGHRGPAGDQSAGSSLGRRAQLPGAGGPSGLGQPQDHGFGLRAASALPHTLSLPRRSPRQGFGTGVPANPWGYSSCPAILSRGLKEAEATSCCQPCGQRLPEFCTLPTPKSSSDRPVCRSPLPLPQRPRLATLPTSPSGQILSPP